MERHGLSRVYPLDYYADMQRRGLLFVLEGENGALLGAVVLLPEDERWDGQPSRRAWYVHNLVTAIGASGAGKAILREARKLASSRSMESMRLDCADDNMRLNAWYESQGYFPCGTCIDGPVQRNSPREAALKRVLRYSGQNGSQTLRVWLVTYSSIVGIEILSVPWASNSAM